MLRQLHIPPNVRCNLNVYHHNFCSMKFYFIKSSIILVIILSFCGCSDSNNKNSFVSIDYSYFWGYYRSIKIDKNGKVDLQYDYSHPENTLKYHFQLTDSQLDSIIRITDKLYDLSLDSIIIQHDCMSQCVSVSLIVQYHDHLLETSYKGNYYSEPDLIDLFRCAEYLDRLMEESIESMDSSFAFQSKSKLILPPPPPKPSDY